MTFNRICIVFLVLQIKLTVSMLIYTVIRIFFFYFNFFPNVFVFDLKRFYLFTIALCEYEFFCDWICWFKCVLDRPKRITHNNRTYLYEVPTLVWLQSECKLQMLMYKLDDIVDNRNVANFLRFNCDKVLVLIILFLDLITK